ncbi:hypothetical protein BDP27DRAFT_1317015 [Rhodocollybia butyracea]|uniref:FAD-binding domain-containing protein n=1 Tax=Rhodocollybia butyracea TaxID=206335 RepID=A0A9P5PXI5_9AGAR|nr:hypothetical protein BDP27DRAFT_1317015 [Rhodocollybia butyracea]
MIPSSNSSSKTRLAIVGGGIGGLLCAVALKDCLNIEIDLYEQALQITEIGAGIALWSRTRKFLEYLGLKEDLVATLPEGFNFNQPPEGVEFRISDRKEGFTFLNGDMKALPFHRQDLQQTLLKHVPSFCRIHLDHRLIKCKEQEDCVELYFKNGSEATCDVLIGADGIKSMTRECFHHKGIFYTGIQVFRGLIPKENLEKINPKHRTLQRQTIYCGKNKHVVVYPISRGRFINVVAFFSNMADEGKPLDGPEIKSATTEEVLSHFVGWEEEVQELLGSVENPSRWMIRDLRPMDTYVSRRISLLGDAAHLMQPHLGAGAGQAMEDGYVLGRLFCEGGSEIWARILQAYNYVRQPYGNMIQRNARNQGFCYELNAPGFEDVKEIGQELTSEQISVLSDAITKNYSWVESDADGDFARAMQFLTRVDS